MLEEEAAVIAGLVVGLNIIDCNLSIKDEDLDTPVSPFIMPFVITYFFLQPPTQCKGDLYFLNYTNN